MRENHQTTNTYLLDFPDRNDARKSFQTSAMVRRLLYLNGLAIFGVVLFHSAGTGFIAMFSWANRYLPLTVSPASQIGSPAYYALRLIEQVSMFSLPAFLFVSGYFVSVQAGRTGNIRWSAIWSRIRTLLIPFLLWSLVTIILVVLEGKRYGPLEFIWVWITGQANEVLYFVPLLIQFYLLAPFFVRAIRWNWKVALLILALVQIVVILISYPRWMGIDTALSNQLLYLIPIWIFVSRILWFPLGIAVGFHVSAVEKWISKYSLWLLAGALVLIPVGMLEWEYLFHASGMDWLPTRETVIDVLYSLALILGVLGLANKRLIGMKRLSDIGIRSYGIYLIHALAITYTAKLIYHFAPALLGYQIILQPVFVIAGLGIPLLMMYVVEHLPIKRFYVYLFG
jgi:peptidoglycan/LPS O-acetylase OafA/YrhL